MFVLFENTTLKEACWSCQAVYNGDCILPKSKIPISLLITSDRLKIKNYTLTKAVQEKVLHRSDRKYDLIFVRSYIYLNIYAYFEGPNSLSSGLGNLINQNVIAILLHLSTSLVFLNRTSTNSKEHNMIFSTQVLSRICAICNGRKPNLRSCEFESDSLPLRHLQVQKCC